MKNKIIFLKSKKEIEYDFKAKNKEEKYPPTILEILESQGIKLKAGCRSGYCKTCEVKIRKGSVQYLSDPPEDLEKDSILPCIASPQGDIEIHH